MGHQPDQQHQAPCPDLSGLLASCARELAPRVAQRGLLFFYDFRGPSFAIESVADTVADIARTLLSGAVESLRSGSIVFSVDVIPHLGRQATVRMQVAHTGQQACPALVQGLMAATFPASSQTADSADQPGHGMADAGGSAEQRVARQCESLQGTLIIGSLPSEGRIARAEVLLSCKQLGEDLTAAAAHGLCAWLIGDPPVVFEAIGQRLQRLGWGTLLLPSVAAAMARWSANPASRPEVGLVLGAEGFAVTPGELLQLVDLLPEGTQAQVALLCAASLGSRTGGRLGGVLLLDAPLEPRQLHRLTQQVLAGVNRRLRLLPGAAAAPTLRPRVLLAEDNLVNQLISTEMLRLLGFEVDVANNGEEAVHSCLHSPPALVLMDLDMPVLSGFDATKQLRELQRQGRLPALPIVAATARVTAHDRQLAQEAGVDGFIEKPIDMALLHAEIRRVMGRDAGEPSGPNRP